MQGSTLTDFWLRFFFSHDFCQFLFEKKKFDILNLGEFFPQASPCHHLILCTYPAYFLHNYAPSSETMGGRLCQKGFKHSEMSHIERDGVGGTYLEKAVHPHTPSKMKVEYPPGVPWGMV